MLISLNRLEDVLILTRDELLVTQSSCFLVEEEPMVVCISANHIFNPKYQSLIYLIDGLVTNSQLFPFTKGQTSILLAPENGNNATCLAANTAGKLDSTTCSGDATSQSFTIVTA